MENINPARLRFIEQSSTPTSVSSHSAYVPRNTNNYNNNRRNPKMTGANSIGPADSSKKRSWNQDDKEDSTLTKRTKTLFADVPDVANGADAGTQIFAGNKIRSPAQVKPEVPLNLGTASEGGNDKKSKKRKESTAIEVVESASSRAAKVDKHTKENISGGKTISKADERAAKAERKRLRRERKQVETSETSNVASADERAEKERKREKKEKKLREVALKSEKRVEQQELSHEDKKRLKKESKAAEAAIAEAEVEAKKGRKRQRKEEKSLVLANGAVKEGKESKKSKKSKSKMGEELNDAAFDAVAPKVSVADQWNPDALGGDEARKQKFLKLLGAGKANGGNEKTVSSSSSKKVVDVARVEADLEKQFEAGRRMKHDGAGKRRGLGA